MSNEELNKEDFPLVVSEATLKELLELPIHLTYGEHVLTNARSAEAHEILNARVSESPNPAKAILSKVIIHHRVFSESIPPGAPTPLRHISQALSQDFRHIPYTPMEFIIQMRTEDDKPLFALFNSPVHGRSYFIFSRNLDTYTSVMESLDDEVREKNGIFTLPDYFEYLIEQLEYSPYSALPDAWCSKRGKKYREAQSKARQRK